MILSLIYRKWTTLKLEVAIMAFAIVTTFLIATAPGSAAEESESHYPTTYIHKLKLKPANLLGSGELTRLRTFAVPGLVTEESLEQTKKRLLTTGKVSAIDVEIQVRGDRTIMILHLTPQRYVKSLTFKGRTQIKRGRLAAALDLKKYSLITEPELEKSLIQLADFYQFLGFPRPEVSVATTQPQRRGATRVTFSIKEQPLAKPESMTFAMSGHPGYFARLRLLTSLKWYRWRTSRLGLNLDQLRTRLNKAERRFRLVGYQDATFTIEKDPDASTPVADVAVSLAVGKRVTITMPDVGMGLKHRLVKAWRRRSIPLTDVESDRLARRVTEALNERGFLDAVVAPSWRETDSKRTLILHAQKGTKYYLGDFDFTGNQAFTPKELSRVITMRRPRLWGLFKSRPSAKNLKASQSALVGYYAAYGFPLAKVKGELVASPDPARTVHFEISEGPQRRIGEVQYEGFEFLTEQQAAVITGMKSGDLFIKNEVQKASVAVQKVYWENGYTDVQIKVVSRKQSNETIDLIFQILEGPSYKLGGTVVRSNYKTKTSLVLRSQELPAGNPFDYEPLAQLKQNLDELDVFASVAVRTDDETLPEGAVKSVIVDLQEKATGYFDGGVDLNSVRGFEVIGKIGNSNLWGRAVNLELSGLAGRLRSHSVVSVSQPFLFGWRLHNFGRVFYSDDRTHEGFSLALFGAEAGVSKRLTAYLNVSLTYRYEHEAQFDVDEDIIDDLQNLSGTVASLTPSIAWDTRDDPFIPTKGIYWGSALKVSTTQLGADLQFIRWEQDFRVFRSLTPTIVLGGAVRLGRAWPIEGSPEIPLAERFFLGGASTDRGFRENDMGPKGERGSPLGGQSFVLANLELRFPLWRFLDGGLFLDAGNVFATAPDNPLMRPTAGFGIRIRTPIGPIRGDIGFNLDQAEGEDLFNVHFALGHAF